MKITDRSDCSPQTNAYAQRLVLLALMSVWFLQPNCTLAQRTEPPSSWAARLAKDYDSRSALEIFNSRDPKSIAEAIAAWAMAIEGRTEEAHGLDLMMFVSRYSPIWNGNAIDQANLGKLTSRVKLLNREQNNDWRTALKAAHGDDVNDLWTCGILVTIEPVFNQGKFDAAQSDAMRARLILLPEAAVALLAKRLNTGKAVAAGKMISQDALFPGNKFNQKYFDDTVKALESALARK